MSDIEPGILLQLKEFRGHSAYTIYGIAFTFFFRLFLISFAGNICAKQTNALGKGKKSH